MTQPPRDDSKYDVSAKIGSDVSISGSSDADLISEIVSLVSPITQGAGAVGDFIRTYRAQSALKALKRSYALAEELDIQVQPVPPKFLFQWVEAVSLEDSEEDDIIEMWAGLLNSAAKGLSPNHFVFIRVLKDLSFQHAKIISKVAGIYDAEIDPAEKIKILEAPLRDFRFGSVEGESLGKDTLQRIIQHETTPGRLVTEAGSTKAPDEKATSGPFLSFAAVSGMRNPPDPGSNLYLRTDCADEFNESSLVALELLGLTKSKQRNLEIKYKDAESRESVNPASALPKGFGLGIPGGDILNMLNKKYISFSYVELTRFGREFLLSCNAHR